MIAETDYYAVLEIPRNASDAQIREAYRLQSLAWHPDRFPEGKLRDRANERMAEINAAYEYLRGKSANSGSERIVSLADVTGRRHQSRRQLPNRRRSAEALPCPSQLAETAHRSCSPSLPQWWCCPS
jgi:hypothetical protein